MSIVEIYKNSTEQWKFLDKSLYLTLINMPPKKVTVHKNERSLISEFGSKFITQERQKEIFQQLEEIADAGFKISQCFVGVHLEIGSFAEKNLERAFKLLESSANQGYRLAQNRLAKFYHIGIFVERDLKKAFDLYTKSAEQKLAGAQINLAYFYENGYAPVKKSFITAIRKCVEALKFPHCNSEENDVAKAVIRRCEAAIDREGSPVEKFYRESFKAIGSGVASNLKKNLSFGIINCESVKDLQIIRDEVESAILIMDNLLYNTERAELYKKSIRPIWIEQFSQIIEKKAQFFAKGEGGVEKNPIAAFEGLAKVASLRDDRAKLEKNPSFGIRECKTLNRLQEIQKEVDKARDSLVDFLLQAEENVALFWKEKIESVFNKKQNQIFDRAADLYKAEGKPIEAFASSVLAALLRNDISKLDKNPSFGIKACSDTKSLEEAKGKINSFEKGIIKHIQDHFEGDQKPWIDEVRKILDEKLKQLEKRKSDLNKELDRKRARSQSPSSGGNQDEEDYGIVGVYFRRYAADIIDGKNLVPSTAENHQPFEDIFDLLGGPNTYAAPSETTAAPTLASRSTAENHQPFEDIFDLLGGPNTNAAPTLPLRSTLSGDITGISIKKSSSVGLGEKRSRSPS